MDAGVPIADDAYIAGTSSTHIENHYRHIEDEMMIRGATRNNNQSIEGRFQPDWIGFILNRMNWVILCLVMALLIVWMNTSL